MEMVKRGWILDIFFPLTLLRCNLSIIKYAQLRKTENNSQYGAPRFWKDWKLMGSRALRRVGASSGIEEVTEVFTVGEAEF